MKKISMIAAVDRNLTIGKKGGLPWKLPADLKHFQDLTTGHVVIMGRKTYDSIGKPLPNRTNIVISGKSNPNIPGCVVVASVEEALNKAPDNQEIFIMGGGEIYNQFLPFAQKLYLTKIDHQFDGDIFFPKLDSSEWKEVERRDFEPDDRNPYRYSFVIMEKTRN